MWKVDPSANGGVASWTDEMSSVNGAIWINGANKHGVLFFGKGPYTTNSNAVDCTPGTGAAHEWYRNAGQGYLRVASSDRFADTGGPIVGETSKTSIAPTFVGNGYIGLPVGARTYVVGETVRQSSSRASSTVVAFQNNETCSHGCKCVLCATGPSTTAQVPLIFFFDPATLLGIRAGKLTDYQQSAVDIVNVQEKYPNFSASCNGMPGQAPASLFAGTLSGAYMTGNTLYVIANDGYHADGCNSAETLIHVFTVDDSGPPTPQPWTLPFAVAGLMWAALGLRSNRS